MAISSPLDVRKINKTTEDSNKSIKQSQGLLKSVINLSSKRIKEKKTAYNLTSILRERSEERKRRDEAKSELTAQSIVAKEGGSQQLVSAGSSSGFLERIIGFLGYLSAGWILRNLPTWIAMGKEFVARINAAGRILSGSMSSMIDIFGGIGSLLGAYAQNLASFDFLDTEGRVKTAMSELNDSFGNFQRNMEEALGLITTPLSQGKYSGQNAPPLGSESQDQGAYAPLEPYTGPTSSGGFLNPQEGYAYLRQLGVSHIHALGILANIKGESDFEIGVSEKGGGGGIGLFQYTSEPRKSNFLKAVPDYKTNWKGQIKFAIGEDRGPQYLKMQFSSPEEAAYWWMDQWERPAASVYSGRNTKHNAFIKSFKPSSSQQTTGGNIVSQSSLPPLPPTNTLPGKQHYGASRDGGRKHAGVDFDASDSGTFYSRIGGEVTFIGNDPGGYFKYVDIYNPQLGVTERIAEGNNILVKMGQKVNPGTPVAQGTTNTGVFHYEIRKGKNTTYGFEGTLDPIAFLKNAKPQNQTSSQTPAQISPSPTQQRAGVAPGITPDRKPQDIVVYQPPNQQNIITSSGGGGASSAPPSTPINDFDLLNNFIKNKLLLDLAYL